MCRKGGAPNEATIALCAAEGACQAAVHVTAAAALQSPEGTRACVFFPEATSVLVGSSPVGCGELVDRLGGHHVGHARLCNQWKVEAALSGFAEKVGPALSGVAAQCRQSAAGTMLLHFTVPTVEQSAPMKYPTKQSSPLPTCAVAMVNIKVNNGHALHARVAVHVHCVGSADGRIVEQAEAVAARLGASGHAAGQ